MTEHPFKDLDAGLRKAWAGAIRERWGGSLVQQQEVAYAIADYLEATAPPLPREPGWYELRSLAGHAFARWWDGQVWRVAPHTEVAPDLVPEVEETAIPLIPQPRDV